MHLEPLHLQAKELSFVLVDQLILPFPPPPPCAALPNHEASAHEEHIWKRKPLGCWLSWRCAQVLGASPEATFSPAPASWLAGRPSHPGQTPVFSMDCQAPRSQGIPGLWALGPGLEAPGPGKPLEMTATFRSRSRGR